MVFSNKRKIRLIRQHDSMQCGVAALAMICRYYGRKFSLAKLSAMCPASSEGVSMLAIKSTAEKIGFETSTGLIDIENLKSADSPLILHWDHNHFVVLHKISKNGTRFHVADPGMDMVAYNEEEFKSHWVVTEAGKSAKGIAMQLIPTEEFLKNNSDSSSESISMKFVFGYIKQYKTYFAHIIAGLLVGCLLQLIMPFLTQSIVDVGIKKQDIGFIWLVLLGELMIVFGKTATGFIRRWLILHISMRINISLLSDFFIKLLKLPMSFFDTKLLGDLLQRTSDHSRIQNFLTGQVLNITFSFLSFIVFGIVLLVYNRLIFMVFLGGSIIYGLWIVLFLNKRKSIDFELFRFRAKNKDKLYQLVTSVQEIKLQNCEQRRRWEWEDAQADLFNVEQKSLRLKQMQESGSVLINELKNIFITVLAATSVISGNMTLGEMLAIQYIIGQLNSPVANLMLFIYSLQDVKISLERINEIHERENEENENRSISTFKTNKSIKVNNLDFKYDIHSLKYTIKDISFEIPEGKITAIVGESGSGKTTLIKILLGYYPILNAQVSIGLDSLNNYNLKWWRKQCGVVMQDGVIFSESIQRNIAVSDGDIDFEKLENAAKTARIHDFIMSLPLKYETIIGKEGVGLSQGQKQRILIARAVYKNPDFIILDEATNALDAENEKSIVDNLDLFFKGKTVIVVAHRLSTVRNADQIVVLDSGKIAEIGNHASLIEKRGKYYNLVKNQLELGK